MNANWPSVLASADAVLSDDELLHFGAPQAELLAAAEGTVAVPLTHLALLRVQGEDARTFLHSQFTNDVNHLAAGHAQHAGWCSAKGRMQASVVNWQDAGGGYRLLLAADLLEVSIQRLKMYVLRSKVTLQAEEDQLLFGLSGPQAAAILGRLNLPLPQGAMQVATSPAGTVLHLDGQRYVLVVPVAGASGVWQGLRAEARPAGVPAWRWLDVQAAFPLVTRATREEFVPQMADFEKIGGVSFHKGCYPGQEVVARTQYLGKVKRHLYRLVSAEPLAAGDDLFSPDNPDTAAGKVMTAAPSPAGGHVALAVVQSNYAGNLRLGSREGSPLEAQAVNPA